MGRRFAWMLAVCFLGAPAGVFSGDLSLDIEKAEASPEAPVHLSRRRRYVVFPEGSTLTVATSLQMAACVSPTALSGAGAIFTTGVAWALSYDLPNETIHTKDNKYDFPPVIRRHKRDLFVRMEKLMDSAGMDGKSCLLRTICEATQKLLPRQGVLEEILRLLFTYPSEENAKSDRKVGERYAEAHRAGETSEICNESFPCPVSLLEIGLGFGTFPGTF